MSAPKNVAEAIRDVRLIDQAWDKWQNQQPASDTPEDEQDAWQCGWDAFGSAHEAASVLVREMTCGSLPDAAAKARFLVDEMKECTEQWRWIALDALAADLERICDRPAPAFSAEAWLRRWVDKGGGYLRTGTGLSFVTPDPATFQQRHLLDELQRAQGHQAVAAVIGGTE